MDASSFFAGGQGEPARLHDLVASAGDRPIVGDLDSLALAPTVPAPGKILCVGLNYRRHAAESGMAEPKEPVLFSKFNNTLAPHGAAVSIAGLQQVDYESELAVVIGRRGNLPAGIIISGGASGQGTIADIAKGTLNLPSRIQTVSLTMTTTGAVMMALAWLLLGLPLVVNRGDKRLFSVIAQALGVVLLFFGLKTLAAAMAGGFYHSLCNPVTPNDSSENVDQDCLDVFILKYDPECLFHSGSIRGSADIEKVRGFSTVQFDHVHVCRKS